MITTLASASFSETISSWLLYSVWSMLDSWINAALIIIITTILLVGIVGFLWGRAWNKKWGLDSDNRGWVISLALFCSIALGGVNQMYGSLFNIQEMRDTIDSSINGSVADIAKDNQVFGKIMRHFQRAAASDDEAKTDAAEKLTETDDDAYLIKTFSETLADTHKQACTILWSLFGGGVLVMFVTVSYLAYTNIKEIRPVGK